MATGNSEIPAYKFGSCRPTHPRRSFVDKRFGGNGRCQRSRCARVSQPSLLGVPVSMSGTRQQPQTPSPSWIQKHEILTEKYKGYEFLLPINMQRRWIDQQPMLPSSDETLVSLESFYAGEVELQPNEATGTEVDVLSKLRQIMQCVHELDGRFGEELIPSGGYYQGLKVSAPDEFDYMVPVNFPAACIQCTTNLPTFIAIEETTIGPPPPLGYCTITAPAYWDKSCQLTGNGYIIPWKVKKAFKGYIAQAIVNLGLEDVVTFGREPINGPAVTLTINNTVRKVDVDLVPTILGEDSERLPPGVNWPHSSTSWLSRKTNKVKPVFDFVPKKSYYWHISTARMETALLQDLDEDGGCRKKCQRILKKLREDEFCHEGKLISSYHLKPFYTSTDL
ncbi:protein mab-21-like 3 isoform X2 [Glandiceps talaboti]